MLKKCILDATVNTFCYISPNLVGYVICIWGDNSYYLPLHLVSSSNLFLKKILQGKMGKCSYAS